MSKIPPGLTLEDEQQAFYAALGKSITQWQRVEEQLWVIFTSAISSNAQHTMASSAAFHAVINFNSKVAMIDAALTAIAWASTFKRPPGVESQMYVAWNTLKNRLNKRADRRNEMAHFAMHVDNTKKAGHRVYIAPNIINVNALIRHAGKPPTRNTCALILHGNAFQQMAIDLQRFYLEWMVD